MALFLGSLIGNLVLGVFRGPKMSENEFKLKFQAEANKHAQIMAEIKQETQLAVQSAAYAFLERLQVSYGSALAEIAKVNAQAYDSFVKGTENVNANTTEANSKVTTQESALLIAILLADPLNFAINALVVRQAMVSAYEANARSHKLSQDSLERGLTATLAGNQAAIKALEAINLSIIQVVNSIVTGILSNTGLSKLQLAFDTVSLAFCQSFSKHVGYEHVVYVTEKSLEQAYHSFNYLVLETTSLLVEHKVRIIIAAQLQLEQGVATIYSNAVYLLSVLFNQS